MSCKTCGECNKCDIDKDNENEDIEENEPNIKLYIIAVIFFVLSFIPFLAKYKILFYILSILFSGIDLMIGGVKNIFRLNFEENTLMAIAVIAAFALGEYPESCLVVLLYKLGEMIEDRAKLKSEENIKEIAKIKAENANLVIENEIKIIKSEDLKVGDTILIKPGEKVPADSIIIKGNSTINTSSLTGESKEVYVEEQNTILAGSINIDGSITAKVIRQAKDSASSKIVDLVYEATKNKGKTEKFITKFSKIYTPIVIILAVCIAVIPASFGILDYITWIKRSLVFLVASCPCSIVISIPLALFSCVRKYIKKRINNKRNKTYRKFI